MADEETIQRILAETDERPSSAWQQVTGLYAGMAPAQRRLIGIVAAGAFVAFAYLLVSQITAPPYKVLARGLLPEDQQAAVSALESEQIAYKLGPGGTVLVAEDMVHQARMQLATSVMPSGRLVGFELFDTSEIGRSSFAEKINYHRALQGELSRTIQHLNAIQRARVHLVIPQRRLFEDDEVQPSASVVLTLKPGATLGRKQVDAIRQLVSGAIERLEIGQVSIVDQTGRMLAKAEDDGWVSEESLEYQQKFESNLERRVVTLLEPVAGHGRVRAQVAAELDFSHVIETEEKYNPESQVVRSEREKTDKSTNQDRLAGGVPGVASNLPGASGASSTSGSSGSAQKSDHTKNYEIDKSTLRRETPHVRIQRLSVAVVVDSGTDDQAIGEAALANYRKIVAKAVGADVARGDAVEVVAMPFFVSAADIAAADAVPAEPSLMDDPIVFYGVLGGSALAFLITLFLAVKRLRAGARLRRERAEQEKALLAAQIRMLESGEMGAAEVQRQIDILRAKAVDQGSDDVRRTATVIRSWLRAAEEGGTA